MINAFDIFHTRLIGASQHVRRVQNPRKIGPENILKNILKRPKIVLSMERRTHIFNFRTHEKIRKLRRREYFGREPQHPPLR